MITYQIITAAQTILETAEETLVSEGDMSENDLVAALSVGPRALKVFQDFYSDSAIARNAFLVGAIAQQVSTDLQNEDMSPEDLLSLGQISKAQATADLADIVKITYGIDVEDDTDLDTTLATFVEKLKEDHPSLDFDFSQLLSDDEQEQDTA